jgi:1-deoxy-D-xylulose-5-phosphate synthase
MDIARRPNLLDGIDDPADLRQLDSCELGYVAEEMRDFLLHSVARGGGHLSAGLGTVELTIALHYVFETPHDALVWDVGHQCYPHKVLTGRRDRMASIRKRNGLSGFLRRDESPHDSFGAGHSSTSISAALGIAVGSRQMGVERKTVAIIGDGSLTAGMAYEALQQAGALPNLDLIIIVNDNGMSISPNVGSLSLSFSRTEMEESKEQGAGRLFEELGFQYFGPCDGHDVQGLVHTLRKVKTVTGPRVVHVKTQKGRGYAAAEADPIKYHGVTPFDPMSGIQPPSQRPAETYTDVFGEWLCEAADSHREVVAITPAMREGSGLVGYAKRHPERYFDVGIAEQHSVTFAAGLATQGLHPVVAIYSSFLQRAYDQLIHDVALQSLPVLFAIDRAGLVGPDGATHNGALDVSFLRCVPGMVIMTPSNGQELRDMLQTGLAHRGPVAVRYPRGAVPTTVAKRDPQLLPIGTAELRRVGTGRIALLAFGTMLATATELGDELDATVVNMRFVKPLDERMVLEIARQHDLIVTLEENAIAGGAGCAVNECLAANRVTVPTLNIGLPDRFIDHGTRDEVMRDAGLDRDTIRSAILARQADLPTAVLHGKLSRRKTQSSSRRSGSPAANWL